eukprot:Gregarina_sp_Poly_1__9877@NODE_640_length_7000_cov_184_134574_g489_i0_p5_GENE_NODE_640_length_7000_cov_184_134574_g489_i0NODE_640_length_7000_cov_184_134574_g489_i0_p5_ORF_typecomplete_len153_score20_19Methyltransf_4/PF02390_17/7e12Methyltransf_31/PF13847_6/5_5e05Methyltransf_25/PF13649_6/0_00043DOT1/PF08123_13/0_00037MTS/PF05175_14/0_00058CMAS/PF02353_20/0_00068Methyltransf_23/PF13489_6/0_003Methyltransf_12/PF08242_12/0_0038MetW/PF07021_12/0_0083FmrO/PF07091_11/0_031Methyltransf_11/PF08241_12/0
MNKRPRKAQYRQRAHCNPLSDAYIGYPPSVEYVDWSVHYPAFFRAGESNTKSSLALNTTELPIDYSQKQPAKLNGSEGPLVEILDVGCGFGGLLFQLAKEYPEKLIMGMEIRDKVTTFVGKKILALREEAQNRAVGMKMLSSAHSVLDSTKT